MQHFLWIHHPPYPFFLSTYSFLISHIKTPRVSYLDPLPDLPHYCGVTYMNFELIGQLLSVAFIVGAGPIIVAAVYARGGNL